MENIAIDMPSEIQDVRLILKIDNKQPIELMDLTRSLVALASQFDKHVSKNGDSKENREAKLYVKEIRTGSVIVELIELATVGLIPFAENVNTILDFAVYLKKATGYFLDKSADKPELVPSDYKELSAIINPIARDNGSQLNLSTTVNGNVELHLHLNSIESNAIQNNLKRELEILKLPETVENIYERVIMTWWQARSDIKSKIGNKGVVEEISEKPMNIVFESDELQAEMLHSDINPFKSAFVVDLRIQNIQGIPRVYKILKLHEYFELDDTSNPE